MRNRSTKRTKKTEGEVSKTHSKKRKIILIGAIASLSIIALGVGLGVGLNVDNTSTTKEEDKPKLADPIIAETYRIEEEVNSNNQNKIVRTLRVDKTISSSNIIKVKEELDKNKVNRKTIDNLHLPYKWYINLISLQTQVSGREQFNLLLKLLKDRTGFNESFDDSKIGFILDEEDFNEDFIYSGRQIVELNLPTSVTTIAISQFQDNKIKKVNWDDLVNLISIKALAFTINSLEGDLDLSKLTNLTTIGEEAFSENYLNGKLTLPPNIQSIDKEAFNVDPPEFIPLEERFQDKPRSYNKIKGTLKIPKSLKTIGDYAFHNNELTELNISEDSELTTIGKGSFLSNKLIKVDLSNTSKLESIGVEAFKNNDEELLTKDTSLPKSLLTIGDDAIKVKEGIKIAASASAIKNKGISPLSFEGELGGLYKYGSTPTSEISKVINYDSIESTDKKEVIIRLKEKTTFAEIKTNIEEIKKNVEGKKVTELRLPYGTRSEFQTDSKLDLNKIKNELGIEVEEANVGYILYPSDETNESNTYQNQNIVEVVLPKTQKKIVANKFKNNKIKKVNWDDLVNVTEIGDFAFSTNELEFNLDLSKLVKLTTINPYAFQQNKLKGTLMLPPNIESIGGYAFSVFNVDKIEGREQNNISGTLKLPGSLKEVGTGAFQNNSISILDWSEAKNLEVIYREAFNNNVMTKLDFTKTSPPKLKRIGDSAFITEKVDRASLRGRVMFPPSLKKIGTSAIHVVGTVTIVVSADANINKFSFVGGDVNIERYTS